MGVMDTLKRSISGEQADNAGNDILDTLKQDHEDVAEMLERLVESTGAAERKSLLASIKTALVPHLRAEEKIVYNAILALRGKEQKTHGEEGFSSTGLATRCSPRSAR
jgi:hypothetical protein